MGCGGSAVDNVAPKEDKKPKKPEKKVKKDEGDDAMKQEKEKAPPKKEEETAAKKVTEEEAPPKKVEEEAPPKKVEEEAPPKEATEEEAPPKDAEETPGEKAAEESKEEEFEIEPDEVEEEESPLKKLYDEWTFKVAKLDKQEELVVFIKEDVFPGLTNTLVGFDSGEYTLIEEPTNEGDGNCEVNEFGIGDTPLHGDTHKLVIRMKPDQTLSEVDREVIYDMCESILEPKSFNPEEPKSQLETFLKKWKESLINSQDGSLEVSNQEEFQKFMDEELFPAVQQSVENYDSGEYTKMDVATNEGDGKCQVNEFGCGETHKLVLRMKGEELLPEVDRQVIYGVCELFKTIQSKLVES